MPRLFRPGGLGAVRHFVGFNLSLSDRVLDGLMQDVRQAAFGHTYLETVGSRADSWHGALRFSSSLDWCEAFTREVARRLPRWARRRAWLLIDVTEEPFYAEPTLDTVPADGERGVKAVWKFLVAALFDPRTRRTIPLAACRMPLGRGLADALDELLARVRAHGITPRLVLADREFYQGAVIRALDGQGLDYLMLVPKNAAIGPMAAQCHATRTWAVVRHEIEWCENKSTCRVPTRLVLWPDDKWDWSFATSLPASQVDGLVARYKLRWNIETLFRVQDEARIKTKSTRAIVRLATFLVSLFVTALWELLSTRPVFKRWLILLEFKSRTGVPPARLPRPDG